MRVTIRMGGTQASQGKEFHHFFPFHKPAVEVCRAITYELTTTRSAIHFMHQTLKHQIKQKVVSLQDEITLLTNAGFLNLRENSKLSEISKIEKDSNQASFDEKTWTGGDLNPRPLECKSSVHTN